MSVRVALGRKVRKGIAEAIKLAGLLAFLAVLMFWLAGTFHAKVEPHPAASPPPDEGLRTAPVELRSFTAYMDQVGTVRSRNTARIASRILAQVVEVPVEVGDDVDGRGPEHAEAAVLARLDDREIQARLEQTVARRAALDQALAAAQARVGAAGAERDAAAATLEQAESDLRRWRGLFEDKAATAQHLEQAEARFDVAAAQVRAAKEVEAAARAEAARLQAQIAEVEAAEAEARVMLSHTVIRAPFSGRIVRKNVEEGDTVSPGQELLLLETPSLPELEAVVAESLFPRIEVGRRYDVAIDALSRTLPGTLREIVPHADPATRTFTVKVALPPDPGLISGLFGRLRIPVGEYEALVVPAEAVRSVGQLRLVQVLGDDGVARRRFVTVGEGHGEIIEILSGLKKDEAVVVP